MLGIKEEDLVFYKEGMEKGMEKGVEKGIRETILKQLIIRFHLDEEQAKTLGKELEKITELKALEELSLLVLQAQSIQEFLNHVKRKSKA